jgi:hypothetical protein
LRERGAGETPLPLPLLLLLLLLAVVARTARFRVLMVRGLMKEEDKNAASPAAVAVAAAIVGLGPTREATAFHTGFLPLLRGPCCCSSSLGNPNKTKYR